MLRLPLVRLLALLLALPAFAPAARAEIVEGVAAVVNGEVVLLSELEDRIGPGLPPPGGDEATRRRRTELLRRALDELVTEKLVHREAADLGLLPSEQEIDAAVEEVMRSNNIDERTLEYALRQQGLTKERYRAMLSDQLARMKLIEMKVKNRIAVSDEDVKARYAKLVGQTGTNEERRVRDLYLPKGEDPDATRTRLLTARQRVVQGEAFEQVAKELGGPLGASGGDLGWVKRGTMLPELEAVVFRLETGKPSDVLDAAGGWHVLYVEDVRQSAGGTLPLSEAREQIRQQLLQERLQKATEEYVAELRRNADVEIKLQ